MYCKATFFTFPLEFLVKSSKFIKINKQVNKISPSQEWGQCIHFIGLNILLEVGSKFGFVLPNSQNMKENGIY